MIAMIIALVAADENIAGVAIPLMLYDCGAQLLEVANLYRVAGLDAKARARLNSTVILFMFMGQVSFLHKYCIFANRKTAGTAILTKIYDVEGWKATGGAAVGFASAIILFLLLRSVRLLVACHLESRTDK